MNNKIDKLNPSRDKAVSIHHQNLQVLSTEVCEEEYGVTSDMMISLEREIYSPIWNESSTYVAYRLR